jgi:hypothetical protein
LESIALTEGVGARAGVGVYAEIRGILLPQVVQAKEQNAVLEDVCGVPRMEGMAVTEHPIPGFF